MKHTTTILMLVLSATSSLADGPGARYKLDRTEKSPKGDINLEYYSLTDPASDMGKYSIFQVWLSPCANPNSRVQLFKYGRAAGILMAPNEQFLMIDNFPSSSGGGPILYERGPGVSFHEHEVKPELEDSDAWAGRIGHKAFRFLADVNKLKPEEIDFVDHQKVHSLAWSRDSRYVLLSLYCNGGQKDPQFSDWRCVYDVESDNIKAADSDFVKLHFGKVHFGKAPDNHSKKNAVNAMCAKDELALTSFFPILHTDSDVKDFKHIFNVTILPYSGKVADYMTLSKRKFLDLNWNILSEKRVGKNEAIIECAGKFKGLNLHFYAHVLAKGGTIYISTATVNESEWNAMSDKIYREVEDFIRNPS